MVNTGEQKFVHKQGDSSPRDTMASTLKGMKPHPKGAFQLLLYGYTEKPMNPKKLQDQRADSFFLYL